MKANPQNIGLAFSAAGHSLLGIGGISAINGTCNSLVEGAVIAGFFCGVVGTFFSTLYTDPNPPTATVAKSATVQNLPTDKPVATATQPENKP